MKPSEQKKQSYWIWKEYERSHNLPYIEEVVREEPTFLRPQVASDSLLEFAIHHYDVEAVCKLVVLGAEVNTPTDDGYTYLHSAIESSRNGAEIVTVLLNAGANPNAEGTCGRTPLHLAALHGLVGVIPAMIAFGAEIDARTTVDNETTPLMEAAWGGHLEAARCLIELGADASIKDEADMGGNGGGRTAADIAREHNHPEVARLLNKQQSSR